MAKGEARPSPALSVRKRSLHSDSANGLVVRRQMSKTPTLIWAQRVEKVFVTWECLATKDVNVTLSEGLLTVEGTAGNGDVYKLENLPLFLEIEPEGSKWFKNDRCFQRAPWVVTAVFAAGAAAFVQGAYAPCRLEAIRASLPRSRCATCPGLW